MKTLRYMLYSNKFFIRESYYYAGGFKKQPVAWVRAWFRFMKFSFYDSKFI